MKNLTGQRFGKLVVLSELDERNKYGQVVWLCQCDCGNQTTSSTNLLNRGTKKSCGCLFSETHTTHGMSATREYSSWHNMISRTKSKNNKNYGGRNITVCERWSGKNGFTNFLDDMGPQPSDEYSIDRTDNDGNYEPSNCKWSTQEEQIRNRNCVKLTETDVMDLINKYSTNTYSFTDLGKIYNCDPTHIRKIIIGERWN